MEVCYTEESAACVVIGLAPNNNKNVPSLPALERANRCVG
jgi:hypothetical protein